MKTRILSLMLVFFSLTIFAGSDPLITSEKAKTLIVHTTEWKSGTINVQIKEETGVIILDETVKNVKDSRKYNLKNLPSGKYSIEISNELKISTQFFTIEDKLIHLEDAARIVYKPLILLNGNHLDVNLMTLGNAALINILDTNNNIVFSEKLESPVINKRYDISNLEHGDYNVNIAMNGRSFSKSFNKN